MPNDEAITFLEGLRRQAEYRRTVKNANPVVGREAAEVEIFLTEKINRLRSQRPAPAKRPAKVA